ncbi:hypothetical protein TIFTF001_011994, partial [Ficus carica]
MRKQHSGRLNLFWEADVTEPMTMSALASGLILTWQASRIFP